MHSPLISIFIPVYNRKHLLIPCLESALAQTITDIEVVVVDNASTDGAWEVCQEFARRDPRVRIFRNEANVGPGFNGLRCLAESRGYYGKALFSDDLISADFLEKTLPLIANPQVGLVFTAAEIGSEPGKGTIHYKVGNNPGTMPSQEFIYYSMFRQGQVVPNSPAAALFRLQDIRQNVLLHIPSPIMHDYHEHGMGVDLLLYLITAHKYPLIGYVPEALAFFRSHEDSETTSSLATRPEKWILGYQQAKIWFTSQYNYPILLQCLLTQEWVREVYSNRNWVPFNKIASRFLHHPPNLPVANDPANQFIADFRHARKHLADFWLNTPPHLLESICSYSGFLIQVHQILVKNDSKNEPLNDSEQIYVNELVAQVAKGFNEPKALNYFLAAMLYCYPQQLSLQYQSDFVPSWFANEYIKFLLSYPSCFQSIGETENFSYYIQALINSIYIDVVQSNPNQLQQDVALAFTENNNFLPLCLTEQNLKAIYSQRGDIIEFALRSLEQKVEYVFIERSPNREKIRLGILKGDFTPHKETFSTIPIFEYLDRNQFEIILYSLKVSDHPLEQYCQSSASRLVQLPTDRLPSQVEAIRADNLDILLIATNVTTVTNPIALLAQHRLARVQVTYGCSPVTTGIRNIDYYIASKFVEPAHDAQQQYREQLITIDGVGGCFSFVLEPDAPTVKIDWKSFGVSENSVLFVSGANFYKITPELRETWAKIIASVPESVLVLYPFNPAWSSEYPTTRFVNSMNAIFAKYGINKSRLVILDIQGRSNVKECLKLGNVYLDSYPYAGYASLLDSLEVGLPSVVRKGNSLRSRRGAELLQELDVNDLITDSEESYIKLAVSLGTNAELRQRHSDKIKQKMDGTPKFLDSRAYAAQMGDLFKKLFLKHLGNEIGNDLNLRDVNLIIFPDWRRSEESLYEDLRSVISAIATHPDKDCMTLLIDISNIANEDDANLLLSSVAMNLLMEEEVDMTHGPEISLVGQMGKIQWEALLPRLQGQIALENENKEVLTVAKAENLPLHQLDSIKSAKVE
jgi:predicted O-linked N-acetylglucosamine transferase (SPINDLY family)